MGQYYRPCLLATDYKENKKNPVLATADCYFYDNGAKLMEHSYVGNSFVAAACTFLMGNKTNPFVWCGDYADAPSKIYKAKNEGNEYDETMYDFARRSDFDTEFSKSVIGVMDGDRCLAITTEVKFIINHSKRKYVEVPEYKENEWQVHPLPLLTADGCFRGSGDYKEHQLNAHMVGKWAYDIIECGSEVPEGYRKLRVEFKEN